MIECPNCNATEWKSLYRSPVDPADDQFQCLDCLYKFNRYEPLKKGEATTNDQLAKWGERYGLSLGEVKGLGILLRGYKRRMERACNGDPYVGIDPQDREACSKAWEKESEEVAIQLRSIVKRLGFDGIDFGVGLYPVLVKGDDSCIMVP
jgi:hypothetical protein